MDTKHGFSGMLSSCTLSSILIAVSVMCSVQDNLRLSLNFRNDTHPASSSRPPRWCADLWHHYPRERERERGRRWVRMCSLNCQFSLSILKHRGIDLIFKILISLWRTVLYFIHTDVNTLFKSSGNYIPFTYISVSVFKLVWHRIYVAAWQNFWREPNESPEEET